MESENDKMLSGELYNPLDPQLSGEGRRNDLRERLLLPIKEVGHGGGSSIASLFAVYGPDLHEPVRVIEGQAV